MTDLAPAPRARPLLRRLSVARVRHLTPRMLRLTLAGTELAGFVRGGAAGHVRLWIPNPRGELICSSAGPEGAAEGTIAGSDIPSERRSPTRVYTPRRWDPERLELDLDIVLHGYGPLSTWASRARVGDAVVVAGPGGVYTPATDSEWYLLAGDETALPAIATLLEILPAYVEAQVVLEVRDAADEQKLPAHPRAQVRWLHRGELTLTTIWARTN